MPALMQVDSLGKSFPIRASLFSRTVSRVQAVRGVSLEIGSGETVGLVGESGCGKTTLARLLMRLMAPDQGKILFEGADIARLSERQLKPFRRRIQMIFQDPFASLNPRISIGEIIAEPMRIHRLVPGKELKERVALLLKQVGLSADSFDRYPHEFSGGQRQRIGIARAIALAPSLIVADEPVSSLDVSIAFQILELLRELQARQGVSYLFIAHDLRMVKYMSHRIAVMYLGKVVEFTSRQQFDRPLHPYSRALVEAVPVADPGARRKRLILSGEVPSPVDPPSGCSFHPRCPFAVARCRVEEPGLVEWEQGHWAACHLVKEIN